MPRSEIERIIREELRAIADRRSKAIQGISLDDLDLNPFLLKVLGLETPEEIADFAISQRLERSVVTSYGARIQKIAKALAGRGTGVEGADICKEKEGVRYYIQMKAGPKTVNKDISSEINRLLRSATRRNSGSVALLGMTYGKRDRVSSILQNYSQVEWLIGREFWEFISDDPACAQKLFDIAVDLTRNPPEGGSSFPKQRRTKIQEIAEQIRERYGDGEDMWQRLFEDNV